MQNKSTTFRGIIHFVILTQTTKIITLQKSTHKLVMDVQKIIDASGDETLYIVENDATTIAVDLIVHVYDANPFTRQRVRVGTSSSKQNRLMTDNVRNQYS